MFTKKKSEENKTAAPRVSCDRDGVQADDSERLRQNMEGVKHTLLVLSGKGGVGKSTVAVNLAASLSARGKSVGLLDIDIHGPSVPTLLGLNGQRLAADSSGVILPVEWKGGLKVVSVGFMLNKSDDAVIWRGPLKYSIIKQFLTDVQWGELDYLVIDSPPGTGDEPLSVCQLVPGSRDAIIVTTPQEVAISDVRKSISFCRSLGIPIMGVVENMSGVVCPHCGKSFPVFGGNGGGLQMAHEMSVPFLGGIPLEPAIAVDGDAGKPFAARESGDGEARKAFDSIVSKILKNQGE